jgi:peptidoglycan hydrolase-like protein with peptidoglycan-binding domain
MIAGFVLAATLTFSMPVGNLEGSFGADVVSAASGSTSTPKPAPSKPSSGKSSSGKSSSSKSSSASSVLKLGSRGTAVKNLQSSLNKNGYKLSADGIFGKKTVTAVKDYQTKNGLKADGIAGPMTLGSLNPATVKLGSTGAQVKLVQTTLNAKGYKVSVDGVFGKKTLAAVKSFQTKNGLKADGIVGPATHAKLKAKTTPSKPDVVSAASTNVSSIAVLEKSMSKDGKWIIATSKNLSTTKALVLDGTFKHGTKTERNIALYNQDASGKVTARYTLTAPKLTIKSPNARISNGTFKGDVYVNASGFSLAGAKVDGDIYFASQDLKDKFKLGTGTVTGAIKVKAGTVTPPPTEEPDGNSGASEVPDDVTAASLASDIVTFSKSIGTEGKWIITTTKDLVSDRELVLDGTFKNGKKDAAGNDIIQRKIGLYTQDENKKIIDEFKLTAPKLTIKSPNARIQNGTFIGNIDVKVPNFELVNTIVEGTVTGNVYGKTNDSTIEAKKIVGDIYISAEAVAATADKPAKGGITLQNTAVEGNIYFTSQKAKDAFKMVNSTVTGKQEIKLPDVVSAASTEVDDIAVFEKSIGKDGRWIIATTKDLVSAKELVLDGEFLNNKGASQRKIALYSQDADKNITESFRLTAPKLTIKSPDARIQGGTFKGDIYVSAPRFTLVNANVIGNIYFTTQEAKDTFVPPTNSYYRTPILTEVDAVATASLVRTGSALETAIGTNGKWIAAILNDITTTKDLVIDGTFKNTKTPAVQMRKIALYSQDSAFKVTRKFTLAAPTLTVKSPDTSIQKGTFKGDIYVTATGFSLKETNVVGNIYFATEELKKAFTLPSDSSVTGTIGVKTK